MDVLNLCRGPDSRSIISATKVQPYHLPNQDVLAQAVGSQSVQISVQVHLPDPSAAVSDDTAL
jgi:hypothetical protein